MVCVRCFTYNHAPYIVDTLNGFAAQQTTFPFICLIIDDASTDDEQKVIMNYLSEHCHQLNEENTDYAQIICSQHKANINCQLVVLLLRQNHYSIRKPKMPYLKKWNDSAKYHAMCEGDDYWIHPQKLQMQVDFMESHQDYGLIHTDFDLSDKSKRNHYKERYEDDNYFPGIIFNGAAIGTLTVLYRASVFNRLDFDYLKLNLPMGDLPMWIEFSKEAKIKYLNVVTADYRILSESAQHSSDINKLITFRQKALECKQYYANKYGLVLKDGGYTKTYYSDIMKFAYRLGDKSVAHNYLKKAIGKGKLSLKLVVFYMGTVVPGLRTIIGKH